MIIKARTRERIAIVLILAGIAIIIVGVPQLSFNNPAEWPRAIVKVGVGILLNIIAIFFLRSIRRLRSAFRVRFKFDPTKEVTPQEREEQKVQVQEMKEYWKLLYWGGRRYYKEIEKPARVFGF